MAEVRKQIDFIGKRNVWFTISAIVILIGLVSMALPGRGLKLGIDFTGGLLIDVKFEKAATTASVHQALATVGLENAQIQIASDDNTEVIIRTRSLTQDESKAMNQALEKESGKFDVLRVEEVKGVIGSELTRKGLFALLIANVGIIIYVTLRFEYKFALTGIAALIHDVLVVLGFYSILGYEANSSFVAAVLTIVGYSINDTIVIFDRIRENLKTRRREPLADVINLSINQTMARSINTSVTTLLALLAVFFFGGRTIKDFTVALMIGIIAGSYSSIFVASPLWYLWKMREEAQARQQGTQATAPAGTRPTAQTAVQPLAEVAAAGTARTAGTIAPQAPVPAKFTAAPQGAPQAQVRTAGKPKPAYGKKRGKSKKRR